MKRLAWWLLRLYPSEWRARYGEEFGALVEDTPPSWLSNFDLLKGAVRMQFSVPTFPKLAVMLSTVGIVLGMAVAMIVPSQYESTAVLRWESGSVERVQQIQAIVLSRASLARVINDPHLDLYREERSQVPTEDVVELMRRDIHIRLAGNGAGVFSIRFTYPIPLKAQATVNALITRFMEENENLEPALDDAPQSSEQRQIAALEARIAVLEGRAGVPAQAPLKRVGPTTRLIVLDPPSRPFNPIKPNRSVIVFIGFGAGVFLAMLISIFRRRYRPVPPFEVHPA